MQSMSIIGNIGRAAEVRISQGRKFISFRVAVNEKWKGQDGQQHEETTWLDCIISNADHPILPYLKTGTNVFVRGSFRLSIYSSAKLRRMVPSATISVRDIELIGGRTDDVPSRLYDSDGLQHDITKWYYAADVRSAVLMSVGGRQFNVNESGWVTAVPDNLVEVADTSDGGAVVEGQPEQNANSNATTDDTFEEL